jgi:hypothetical protein
MHKELVTFCVCLFNILRNLYNFFQIPFMIIQNSSMILFVVGIQDQKFKDQYCAIRYSVYDVSFRKKSLTLILMELSYF